MEDYENDTDSDSSSSKEQLESELYSVLHYNSFSGELPPELLEKYNIRRENNEFFISLRKCYDNKTSTYKPDSLPEPDEYVKQNNMQNSFDRSSIDNLTPLASKSSVRGECITSTPNCNNNNQVFGISYEIGHTSKEYYSPNRNISTNETLWEKKGNEIIIIEEDESQDSDVIIQENIQEVTYISSSSSVECQSDSNNINDIMLNTSGQKSATVFPHVDEVEEVIKVKWRNVSSPSTWSESMKKYYNKPSMRLKYFDHEKILQEIKGTGAWHILPQDLLPRGRPKKRCTLCRQADHLIKNCPKKFSNCSMCGNPGHSATFCPFTMCLNCGKKGNVFIAMCNQCESTRQKTCSECNQVGHIRSNCPDTWRRFHSTTSGVLNVENTTVNEKLMCCNCGKEGHLYENCRNLYWSSYPPSSFLVKNKTDLHNHPGKRKPANGFELPGEMKKPRWSEPNFNINYHSNNLPNTPQSNKKKKKKKKKTKSPHFQKNQGFNRNNTF